MAKKVIGNLKLRIPAGRATAGPPVGSTLGQVFEDRTFTWKSLGQPVDDMIRERAGIQKGAGNSKTDKVGKITKAQLQEIAEAKMDHLNAVSIEGAMKTIAGTARSMGVEIAE